MDAVFGEVVEKLRRSTVQVKAHRRASGSGIIWSGDGKIVTNAHVVESSSGRPVEVEFWDGRSFPAKIVQEDRRRDLAALEVTGADLRPATLGDPSQLRVGELVIAVGNPMGFIGAASTGIVHRVSVNEGRAWVISQLRLAPGNSGGPLANGRGEVVGINTMVIGGLGFAIPSSAVTRFLSSPRTEQYRLGVVVRPVVVESPRRQFALVVLEVVPNSAADRASLLQGDILLGVQGTRFSSMRDLDDAIQISQGGTLSLQFRRGAGENVRTVVAQMAAALVRAA